MSTTKRKPARKTAGTRARKPDKYDKAIAYLKKHPDEIIEAFYKGYCRGLHPAGVLFKQMENEVRCPLLGAWSNALSKKAEKYCREQFSKAGWKDYPGSDSIRVEHLGVFAAIQRWADRRAKRKTKGA